MPQKPRHHRAPARRVAAASTSYAAQRAHRLAKKVADAAAEPGTTEWREAYNLYRLSHR